MKTRKYLFKKIGQLENNFDNATIITMSGEVREKPREEMMAWLLALADPAGNASDRIRTTAMFLIGQFLVDEEAAKHPERAIGGVMTVPAIANIDEWERAASADQQRLLSQAGDYTGPYVPPTNTPPERSTGLSEAELEAIAGTNGELQILTAQQRLNRDLADAETSRVRKQERQEQERVDQARVDAENAPAPKAKAKAKPPRKVQQFEGLPKDIV
ncbi:hypothetical protein EOS_03395 [Caballeronia mineralivorans PML1(12)]|uniref:Uncharacterized protein n=1 Tax=Caballeronia mineralivorans PML1(12) TaxID=908627 RepID=A0A0J1D4M5_9BURK|nr:hypothetical protein [Caballeronia mineralivorans]KLU27667.1 hypothetical protein EOS_03395 [Caballeronia mineralivorans PML1(12)]